jgi:hypothetical protein
MLPSTSWWSWQRTGACRHCQKNWQQAVFNPQAGAAARPFDQGTEMKFAQARPYADPEAAARKLIAPGSRWRSRAAGSRPGTFASSPRPAWSYSCELETPYMAQKKSVDDLFICFKIERMAKVVGKVAIAIGIALLVVLISKIWIPQYKCC